MNLNFFKFFLLLIVLLFEKVLTYPKIYSKWINFKDKHLIKFKNVSNEEKAYAYFQIKDRLIEAHNNQSNMSYKMSHNEFSHWVWFLFLFFFIRICWINIQFYVVPFANGSNKIKLFNRHLYANSS